MGIRRYRRHSAADKVAILRQVLLEGQAVSMVCGEHDVSPTLFYTWQKQFFENGAAAFAKDASVEQRDLERQVDALRQRLGQKDWVIAKGDRGVREAKKRTWGALRGTWVPHDTRDTVIDFVATLSAETELPATRLLRWLGLSPSKYFDWKQRYEQADEHNAQVPRDHWLEAWETPSAKGTGFVQPRAPHEHWQTDVASLNICGTFYYLCSVLEGCSRANLHWEIRESMT